VVIRPVQQRRNSSSRSDLTLPTLVLYLLGSDRSSCRAPAR
jgi:hypothetical protein